MRRFLLIKTLVIVFVCLLSGGLRADPALMQDEIYTLAWSPDGRFIASGYDSSKLEIYALDTETIIQTIQTGHLSGISGLAWSPDGRRIATGGGGYGENLKIWNVETSTLVAEFAQVGGNVNEILWSANGSTIIVIPVHGPGPDKDGSRPGNAFILAVDTITDSYTLESRFHTGSAYDLIWGPEERFFASTALNVRIRDAVTYEEVSETCIFNPDIEIHIAQGGSNPAVLAWHPDGRSIACGTDDGRVALWSVEGDFLFEVKGIAYTGNDYLRPWKSIMAVFFNENGTELSSIGGDGLFRTWNLETQTLIHEITLPGAPIWTVALSPDKSQIAYADANRQMSIIDYPVFDSVTPTPSAER